MKRMVTLVEHRYATQNLMPGDEFDCHDSDVVLLTALGRCKPAEEKPTVQQAAPQKVEPQPVAVVEDKEEDRPKRRYTRRDMTAED